MTSQTTASEYLTTKEVAALLRLKERKIYDLAAEEIIPCTRATGKLLFSRVAIDQWLQQNSSGAQAAESGTVLIAGSHDPLLEWAVRDSQCGIATSFDGSLDGLQQFTEHTATVAAIHLFSTELQQWNIPQVVEKCSATSGVLVNWVYRQRGLVFKSARHNFKNLQDITGCRVSGRQAGAGSQILLDSLLSETGIEHDSINYSAIARSESDAVLAVVEDVADCTFGLQSLASQHQLGFMPLIEEPLDLLIDRRFWFEDSMQSFISFCQSDGFIERVERLEGYRIDKPFEVRHNC